MAPKCEPLCHFGDRLYFTTFPHPPPSTPTLNRLAADPGNVPRVRARQRGGPSASPDDNASYYYFTIDDQLLYFPFFQDWGPLNIAMVYKACILIHELLEDKNLASHRLVLYSSDESRRKANAALLMALYVMIVQRRAPWEAFHPISELEFVPFRDAGRGPADFNLNIQDCLWGLWKAMQNGLCDMNEFSVEEYEYYEKVDNGDWNWITPNFIAFASPSDPNWRETQPKDGGPMDLQQASASPRKNLALQRKLPQPFLNCLDYFEKRNIKLVIRLNTKMYDRNTFLERGIDHMELYFDDGTNPTDEIVRTFIEVSDRIIEQGGVVAVHCKAGLGRTGTLIGAYLVWKYGFTANEAIAFMRIVRPGSVVGPQQQYMYLKQLEWAKWAAVDEMKRQTAMSISPQPVITPATPPADTDDEMRPATPPAPVHIPPVTPGRHIATAQAKARAIAPPGQPRKGTIAKRVAQDSDEEETGDVLPALGAGPNARARVKTAKPTAPRGVTASEPRPTRVTRSAVIGVRKTALPPPASPIKSNQGPNKIPRLATARTTAAAKALAAGSKNSQTTHNPVPVPRRVHTPGSPGLPPSRLPTLMASKRANHVSTMSEVNMPALRTRSATAAAAAKGSDPSWVHNNSGSVVVPGSKSERPGLKNTRRRRSSFSAADVVA